MVYTPKWEEAYGAAFGLAVGVAGNLAKRRPWFSRGPYLAAWTVVGVIGGSYVHKWTEQKVIARETMILDYIRQHPEDFPKEARKKNKDVMENWFPIR